MPNFGSRDVDCAYTPSENIYVYNSPKILWLIYGLALAFTLFSVLVGILALRACDFTASTDLSFVIASAQSPELAKQLSGMPCEDAADSLAGVKLRFNGTTQRFYMRPRR